MNKEMDKFSWETFLYEKSSARQENDRKKACSVCCVPTMCQRSAKTYVHVFMLQTECLCLP